MVTLSDISKAITKLFKKEITRQDLIDTGLLLRTIEAKVMMVGGEFTIDVLAPDYFVYVDGDFNVTDNVYASSGFDDVLDMMATFMAQELEKELE